MPTNSTANGEGDANANGDLLRDLRAILIAGWQIHIELMPNPVGAVAYALLVFNNPTVEPRSGQTEVEAVMSGMAPSVPVRMQIDLFKPDSLAAGLRRFRETFLPLCE